MQGTYRHELKYSITYGQYCILKPRLQTIMHLDPHTDENGLYHIHSVYFDNYRDKALREKILGVQKREKYRIRWYNDNKAEKYSLEKKMKINNLCMKFSAALSPEQFHMIMNGEYTFLMDGENEILQEFYHRLTSEHLRPLVLVSYSREPYIYRLGNVRITFDSRISSSLARHNFAYDSPMISATDNPSHIVMEVKYDEYLPDVISHIIQLGNIRQNAFSKYGICRRFG